MRGSVLIFCIVIVSVPVLAGFIPGIVEGQVVISEVMYDVAGTDTDREWIEVFNSGSSSVHLTEWKLYEANTNHSITAVQGGGSLASGAYAIVADNATKFLIDWPTFSGALFDSAFSLSNSGETLVIRTPELADSDTVVYQASAGAAGDGNSLRRGSVANASLSAAAPTPGSGSLAVSGSNSNSTATTTQETTQAASQGVSAPVPSYVTPPMPEIFVDAGDDRTVIVAADVEFYARAYNRDKVVLDAGNTRFLWNFGDGTTAEGPAVAHHFDYPGRYMVVVNIANDMSASSDGLVVTAEPARLSFSVLPDGGVAIGNLAGRDLDLSRWLVKSYLRAFVLPEHSVVLAGETFRISQRTLQFAAGAQTELQYPNGTLALRAGESTGEPPYAASPTPVRPPPAAQKAQPRTAPTREEGIEGTGTRASSTQTAAAASVVGGSLGRSSTGEAWKWWFAAFALSALSAGALYFSRRYAKGEWNIIEESGDTV